MAPCPACKAFRPGDIRRFGNCIGNSPGQINRTVQGRQILHEDTLLLDGFLVLTDASKNDQTFKDASGTPVKLLGKDTRFARFLNGYSISAPEVMHELTLI